MLADRLRLYVVTAAPAGRPQAHVRLARTAVDGGATAIQLRAPELPPDDLVEIAGRILRSTRPAGVLLVVNDRVDVAVGVDADGVHLGQSDGFRTARRHLHPAQLLGVSVRDPDDVGPAVRAGADYLGVTVWPTPTKPDAVPGGLDLVRRVVDASPVPVVAIGGITAGNAARVLAAGAAGIAVSSAVAGADDPVAATRQLRIATRRSDDRNEGARS